MGKALVSFSGGINSVCTLISAMESNDNVECLFIEQSFINYFELIKAKELCYLYKTVLNTVSIRDYTTWAEYIGVGFDKPSNYAYYDEETKQSTLPCQTLVFGSFLASIAYRKAFDSIWLGVSSGGIVSEDEKSYPDQKPALIAAFYRAVEVATEGTIKVVAPFLYSNKTQIIGYGNKHNVPWSITRTCYSDSAIACGKCKSCRDRLKAFQLLQMSDPLKYADI